MDVDIATIKDWMESYERVKPYNARKTVVDEYAEKAAKSFGINPADSLEQLITNLGGRIEYFDLSSWANIDGSIFVHKQGNFDIILPLCTGPIRDRFTLAHELGHYILHANQKEQVMALRSQSGPVEWEANWFAAGFLMPKTQFLEKMDEFQNNAHLLSAYFGVSISAAQYRIQNLADG